jgi:hypothetical protein
MRSKSLVPRLEPVKLLAGQTASTTVFLNAQATARWRIRVAGAPSDDVSYSVTLRRLGRAVAAEELPLVPQTWLAAEDGLLEGEWTNWSGEGDDVVLVLTFSNEHSWFNAKTLYFATTRGAPAVASECKDALVIEDDETPLSDGASSSSGDGAMTPSFVAAAAAAAVEARSKKRPLAAAAEPPPPLPSLAAVPIAAADALRDRVGALEALLGRMQRSEGIGGEGQAAALPPTAATAAESVAELRSVARQIEALHRGEWVRGGEAETWRTPTTKGKRSRASPPAPFV